jgi:NTP pyrophosphatase (non-canonical NTP hydrolase)
MEIKEAQQKVDELVLHYGEYWEPLSQLARLMEEVGELSRALNVKFGEKKSKFKGDGGEMNEELADVLFSVFALANSQKIDIEKELEEKIRKDFEKMKGVYFKENDNTNS